MDIIIADTMTGSTAYIKNGTLITEPDMNITLEIARHISRAQKPAKIIGDLEIYTLAESEGTMKYYVVATHWDNDKQTQAKYIAGEFPDYYLAEIFRKAYNKTFSANAKVVSGFDLVNV